MIEKSEDSLSASCPDLPGCVATGATQPEVEKRMHDALRLHLDNMRKEGLPIPKPTSIAVYIEA